MPDSLDSQLADTRLRGWVNGLVGVIIFSGSLPMTRLALGGFDAMFITFGRAAVAGLLAIVLILVIHPPRPGLADLKGLTITAFGVVVAFPLLMALALQHMTSARGLLFMALLPMATAIFGVLRAGERPKPLFWAFSLMGCACVMGFAATGNTGQGSVGDLEMIGAVVLCGLGYAEGAVLARRYGGWQVICWVLILSLPLCLGLSALWWPAHPHAITWAEWGAMGYVSVFSMLVGFLFWYRGMALGGIAAVGQLQLLQPFFGFILAAFMLGETIGWPVILTTTAVVGCVAGARKAA
ncbi:MAG TPA: DMT family transporter [Stellaceae bacterium]|nr:DMT family transporter [Stellaceae bacterium]